MGRSSVVSASRVGTAGCPWHPGNTGPGGPVRATIDHRSGSLARGLEVRQIVKAYIQCQARGRVWSEDGKRVVFTGTGEAGSLFEQSLGSEQEARLLLESPQHKIPTSIS